MWHPSLAIHQAAWGEVTGRTASPPPPRRPAGRRSPGLGPSRGQLAAPLRCADCAGAHQFMNWPSKQSVSVDTYLHTPGT